MRRVAPAARDRMYASSYIWMSVQAPAIVPHITVTSEAVCSQWRVVKPWPIHQARPRSSWYTAPHTLHDRFSEEFSAHCNTKSQIKNKSASLLWLSSSHYGLHQCSFFCYKVWPTTFKRSKRGDMAIVFWVLRGFDRKPLFCGMRKQAGAMIE